MSDDAREAHMAKLHAQIEWLRARPRRNWLARLWNVSMFKLSAYLHARPLDPHFIAKGLESELRAMQDLEYQSATRITTVPDSIFTYVDEYGRQILVPLNYVDGPTLQLRPTVTQKPRKRLQIRNARTFYPRGQAPEDRPASAREDRA